ncbi:hypothetical protein [Paenibacillus crassostreae]|uniref:Pectate lyase superfamily protein domain-containing protein n=1 Tax=Paenibacillus crassostreae TaxID=1763538 RepID=A0A167GC75_9BACL|nr:hypothetical protein [Paenibacillus crassostreae]AOZ92665.1 hypothetical protein LPB68_10835 [Paenibacillus crassostreae]OAB77434.1 hypothetical protein PNBC_01830 [Paenibacillus crassostreae]
MAEEHNVNPNEISKDNPASVNELLTIVEKAIIDTIKSVEQMTSDITAQQLKETEIEIQKKIDECGISISEYGADPTGSLDSHGALLSALTASDEIRIPKGVYLIGQNITIPVNKELVFSRNARLKPANGVSITINGTWSASNDDWIFDMSLGGIIGGDFRVDEIHPEWTGAKADGSDDAKAFNDAMTLCAKKRILKLGAKTYKVRSTIENNSRGIIGVQAYIDSGNSGTLISFDPIDTETDLLPCIRVSAAGVSAVFEKFKVMGKTSYNSRYLSRWIDKTKFEAGTYDMFATGTVAIEVADGAKPTFRDVATSNIKVGLLMNSLKGHITSYDSSWSGLIGVYCRKNSEDYYFQGGSITGSFCGVMLGIILTSNHRGGMSVKMNRVHMGFCPYSFYQVKDANDYDSLVNCIGLNGVLESVRFEQTGEACIKLLPKAETSGYISGLGLSWSVSDYTDEVARWQYSLPDDLMLPEDKQKYAFYFGRISRPFIIENWDGGEAYKSPRSVGAIGTAYIDHIATSDINLTGLGDPSLITIRRKQESTSITLTTPRAVEDTIHSRAHNPISHGQLVNNPEIASNWTSNSGTALSIVTDLSELPVGLSGEVKSFLGENLKILKITPDGVNFPSLSLSFLPPAIADTDREICYEYFTMCEVQTRVRSNIAFLPSGRVYDTTYNIPAMEWVRIQGRGLKPPNSSFLNTNMGGFDKISPSYVVGLMINYDNNGAYSPQPHAFTRVDFEIGDKGGLILTDTTDGSRSKITLTNGALQSENTNIKTKVYSPNGVPYKLTVADDGTLTTSLDALFYDSFDGNDSTTSLGNRWTVVNGIWGRLSNEAYNRSTGTTLAILTNNLGSTKYNVGCTMKGQLSSNTNYSSPGILFKYISKDNYFWAELINNSLRISRRVTALDTIVASTSVTLTDDVYYKMRVAVHDDVISIYLNGDLILNYFLTPSDITTFGLTEIVGLRHRSMGIISTPVRFNNFVVEQI